MRTLALVAAAWIAALLPAQDSRAAAAQDSRAHPATESRDSQGCASCHAAQQLKHAASVHGSGAATCVDCHGGDGLAKTEKEAHSGTYLGKIDRAAIPRLCGDCHSDVAKMTPFGLTTDQLKAYAISRHGVAVLHHKNVGAAVCIDCHSAHDARRSSDPAAAIYPTAQPATCDRCHGREDLMKPAKLRTDAAREFVAGAHGKALAAGDRSAPTCSTCHGSHGAMAPGSSSVADVCGRCHEAEKAAFRASRHGGHGGGVSKVRCIDCHGAHRADTVGNGDVAASCAQCHTPDSPEWAAAQKFQQALRGVDGAASRALAHLDAASLDRAVSDGAARLRAELVAGMAKARAAGHSLDVEGVRQFADRVTVIETDARRLAEEREETLAGRRVLAVGLAVLVAAVVAGLLMVRHLARSRRARRGAPEALA